MFNLENSEKPLKKLIFLLLLALLLYMAYYWLLPAVKGLLGFIFPLVLPFLLGIVIAVIIEPIITFVERKTPLSRGLAIIVVMAIVITTLIVGLTVVVTSLVSELTSLSKNIPQFSEKIYLFFNNLWTGTQNWYLSFDFPLQIMNRLEEMMNSLMAMLQHWADVGTKYLLSVIFSLPSGMLVLVFTILAVYFILRDWRKIGKWFVALFPEKWQQAVIDVGQSTSAAITGYLVATLILAIITTLETLLGLLILRVDYAWLFAVVVGLADILPVLGPGTIFIPWIIWEIVNSNFSMAIALAILYAIITVVRQVLQPKIVGDNVGLHPLEALVALYIGLKAMGVLGVLIGPIILVILKTMWHAGIFRGGVDK